MVKAGYRDRLTEPTEVRVHRWTLGRARRWKRR
jgi:hypothetical protein